MTIASTVAAAIAALAPWTPVTVDANQATCLARAIWGESRGSFVDMPLVAFTAIHRASDRNRTVCAIVRQRHQFKGYWKIPKPGPEWDDAVEVAVFALGGMWIDQYPVQFFVRKDSYPSWTAKLVVIGSSEKHRYMQ